MKTKNKIQLSKNEITFRNFAASCDLQKAANLRLLELLAMAPPGADGGGLVDKVENQYYACALIQSAYRSFIQYAVSENPTEAVGKVLDRLENDIFSWRYGTGTPQAQSDSGRQRPVFVPRKEEVARHVA